MLGILGTQEPHGRTPAPANPSHPAGSQTPLKIPAGLPCWEEGSIGREMIVLCSAPASSLELLPLEQKIDGILAGRKGEDC